jgi:hypothetical protein
MDPKELSAEQAKNQIALIRRDRREILRDAAFLFTTPRVTPRINSGCADLSAAFAASLSPVSIAVSTLLIKVRMRLRRLMLVAVLRSSRRTRFFADDVLAIGFPLKRALVLRGKSPGVKGFWGPGDDYLDNPFSPSDGASATRTGLLSRLRLGRNHPDPQFYRLTLRFKPQCQHFAIPAIGSIRCRRPA